MCNIYTLDFWQGRLLKMCAHEKKLKMSILVAFVVFKLAFFLLPIFPAHSIELICTLPNTVVTQHCRTAPLSLQNWGPFPLPSSSSSSSSFTLYRVISVIAVVCVCVCAFVCCLYVCLSRCRCPTKTIAIWMAFTLSPFLLYRQPNNIYTEEEDRKVTAAERGSSVHRQLK